MRGRVTQVLMDGVIDADDGVRWWQVPEISETDRTHRGIFRRVLLMLF